jgi:hypothetical protein
VSFCVVWGSVGVWCNWCGALTSNRSVRISMVENVSIKLMLIGIQFTIFGSILLMMNWQPASAYVLILFFGVRIQLRRPVL